MLFLLHFCYETFSEREILISYFACYSLLSFPRQYFQHFKESIGVENFRMTEMKQSNYLISKLFDYLLISLAPLSH